MDDVRYIYARDLPSRCLSHHRSSRARRLPIPAYDGQSFGRLCRGVNAYCADPSDLFAATHDVAVNQHTVRNGRFLIGSGVDGIVLDHTGAIVRETAEFANPGLTPARVAELLAQPVTKLPGHLYVGSDPASYNYYHWINYGLAKLKIMERFGDPDIRFVVPNLALDRGIPTMFSWATYEDSLGFFDVARPPTRLDPGLYEADAVSFLWTNLPLPHELLQTSAFKDVFRGLAARLPIVPDTPARVFASRSKALSRQFDGAYETALRAMLASHGFTTVLFEDLPFLEQATVLKNAEYFVSAHGAGLTNMLFAGAGLSLLELNRDIDGGGALRACFYLMAEEMGHRYMFLDQTDDTSIQTIEAAVGRLVARDRRSFVDPGRDRAA